MKTPIVDFLKQYAAARPVRLHMPGHKGSYFLGPEHMDITEVEGADVLYRAQGIIAESQQNAAELFGSGATYYSCEGSSLAIRAMLYLTLLLARSRGDDRPLVLAARGVHQTFVSALALLDMDVKWIYPDCSDGVFGRPITPEGLELELAKMTKAPAAVYLTSPDYLGNVADVRALSEVCHRHGTLLLVDNAHGAYLRFLPVSRHPMDLGADMCCDSAHKTLPVLTGGAYLHISKSAPTLWREQAMQALGLFASTSPSYLILQSLDRANAYLSETYRAELSETVTIVNGLKQELLGQGFTLVGDEPLKLTLAPKSYGYTGAELADHLLKNNIICEFSDEDYTVLMVSPQNTPEELSAVRRALLELAPRGAIRRRPPAMTPPTVRLSVRRAMFAPSCVLPTESCEGRVLAQQTLSCPPAIPIVVCGEEIDSGAIALLKYYGVRECRVTAEEGENCYEG